MSGRISGWLERQGKSFPGRKPWPFELTPGQHDELCAEMGKRVTRFATAAGIHPVVRVEPMTRALGDNVLLMGRDDLFLATDDGEDGGVQLFYANSVTSIPDNIGCCEVISVGELVTNVKPGDVCYIDFFEVKQPLVVEHEELYAAGADAFKAKFDPKTGLVEPLPNYVITTRSNERFKVGLHGTDTIEVPAFKLTEGIAGGKNSSGGTSSHIVYEEVVAVGPLTKRPRPGVMTRAEALLIETCLRGVGDPDCWEGFWEAIHQMRDDAKLGRPADIAPGELVMFCKEISTPIRVRGEFQSLIPYDNVLAAIDDAGMLQKAIREGRANLLKRAV
jgi:hypothetical protein